MSIRTALESEGIDSSECIKPLKPRGEQTLLKNINGQKWVCCPYCGKKIIKLFPETKIHALPVKCKGSSCRKEFLVNA